MVQTTNCQQNDQGRDLPTRRKQAAKVRDLTRDDAFKDFETATPPDNGDEKRFEKLGRPGFASFSKALKHDSLGFVNPASFNS